MRGGDALAAFLPPPAKVVEEEEAEPLHLRSHGTLCGGSFTTRKRTPFYAARHLNAKAMPVAAAPSDDEKPIVEEARHGPKAGARGARRPSTSTRRRRTTTTTSTSLLWRRSTGPAVKAPPPPPPPKADRRRRDRTEGPRDDAGRARGRRPAAPEGRLELQGHVGGARRDGVGRIQIYGAVAGGGLSGVAGDQPKVPRRS